MRVCASRAGRWPLALTLMALGACDDAPSAPTFTAVLTPNAAVGDVYLVTNTNDSGIGSLRWALGYVTGGETIRFDPGLGGQTITVDSTLTIPRPATIEGPVGAGITISGGGKARVFEVPALGTVTFRNLGITGGKGAPGYGAIMGASDVVLENSVVYGNQGAYFTAISTRSVVLINSTVSGNTGSGAVVSGAVQGYVKVELVNSTIANNEAGGINGGSLVLRNSILSKNGSGNCLNDVTLVTRTGTNLSDDDTCGGPSNMLIADPKLGALADNGGPTKTLALLAGSPAINAGTSCSVQVDQRYAARDAQCDLGAYEFADFTAVTITIDPTTVVNHATGWATLTGTVKCSRDETFKLALELHQPQRVGKEIVDVHSAAMEPVTCTSVARPWSASMVLTEGAFQNGGATATAQMVEAEPWVAPAAASASVKMYWSRR